jgi:hypothetical protein
MPGQSGSEKRELSAAVLVRMTPEMKAALQARCDEESVSAHIREELTDYLILDHSHIRPSQKRGAPKIRPDDVREVSKLAGAVRKSNGAVVQLAKAIREAGQPLHAEIEEILTDLREQSSRIDVVAEILEKSVDSARETSEK